MATPVTRLIPATQWNDHHPWPPLGGLRHLIFHAKENGFDKVAKRAGRRILTDEYAFFAWVEEQNKKEGRKPKAKTTLKPSRRRSRQEARHA